MPAVPRTPHSMFSSLPSPKAIAWNLLRTWVAFAAVGKSDARAFGGAGVSGPGEQPWDGTMPGHAGAPSGRLARALLAAEGPISAVAPSVALAPSPASGLAPHSAPLAGPAPAPVPAPMPAFGPTPATSPAPSRAPERAPLPSTGIVLPVSVRGTQFVDGNGEQAYLLGVNMAANDACGVAPRTTDDTVALYRAYAEAMKINMIAQDIILTPQMIENPSAMDDFVDIARRVQVEIPGLTLLIRPLTDVALDGRSVPAPEFNVIMANLAHRMHGLPVGISLGKELHRSKADYAGKLTNAAVNQQMRAGVDAAYRAIREANPDMLLLVPGLLDPDSGAQYSRSAGAYKNNFNYTNAAVAVDLYTTEATEAGQLAQVRAWALDHVQELPIIVTEVAPYAETSLGVNMTEKVFNQTFAALANQGVPVALWSGEYKCAPSMVDQAWSPSVPLSLNHWGRLAQSWIQSYIG